MKVIGIKKFHYKSRNTGNEGDYANLYCVFNNPKVDGLQCETLFCRQDILPSDLVPGCEIGVYYNRFGNPVEIYIKES